MGTATLSGKTLFITGASRGIGKAIALRAARPPGAVYTLVRTRDTASHKTDYGHAV